MSWSNPVEKVAIDSLPLWKPYMFNCRTKEEMLVCLKYCLSTFSSAPANEFAIVEQTHESTLEKSVDGDMTKLSFVVDQEIRCWMFRSSSMLPRHQLGQRHATTGRIGRIRSLTCIVCG